MPTRERRAAALGVCASDLPDRRGRHGNHARSSNHPSWSNARMVSDEGYVKVRVGRGHPLADPNGYTYEHLLVWVGAGNSRPTAGQVLHHMNEVKTDNRIGNLELLDRAEHNRRHLADRRRCPATGRLLSDDTDTLLEHREVPHA